MGVVCETICCETETDKKEVIMEVFIKQPAHNRKSSNSNEPKADLNPTHDSKCHTNCHKSSLAQQPAPKDEHEQSNGYPDISIHKQIMYQVPVLDPTISIDKDHPFFYRKYGTEIKTPAVRQSLKEASEIGRDKQLSRTFNSNDQKGKARYLSKSAI